MTCHPEYVFPPIGGLDDFDEAYETSEFEEDDGASIIGGGAGGDKASKAKLATADDDTVRRLENCFKKLTWARGSSSLLKRFLTKKVSRVDNRETFHDCLII